MTTINTDEIATMDVLPVIVERSEAPDIVIGPILHGRNPVDAELEYSWFFATVGPNGPESWCFGSWHEGRSKVCRDWLIEKLRKRGYKVWSCTTMKGMDFIGVRLWSKHFSHPEFSNELH
jgi:hypothetical protein